MMRCQCSWCSLCRGRGRCPWCWRRYGRTCAPSLARGCFANKSHHAPSPFITAMMFGFITHLREREWMRPRCRRRSTGPHHRSCTGCWECCPCWGPGSADVNVGPARLSCFINLFIRRIRWWCQCLVWRSGCKRLAPSPQSWAVS